MGKGRGVGVAGGCWVGEGGLTWGSEGGLQHQYLSFPLQRALLSGQENRSTERRGGRAHTACSFSTNIFLAVVIIGES